MSHWCVRALNQDKWVHVYPTPRDRSDTSFDEVAKRIGMMVLAERIERVTVYRDGEVYRQIVVQSVNNQ